MPPKSELSAPRERLDPWNSVSTGHQKDGNNRLAGSTGWRQSRTSKLAAQFRGGPGGGRRIADSVGAGSVSFGQDGRKASGGWERGASGLRRATGCADVGEMLKERGSKVTKTTTTSTVKLSVHKRDTPGERSKKRRHECDESQPSGPADQAKRPRKVFDGLCFYINGSTAPAVSDHRLKHMIAENGGRVAIGLARKTVTHVVLGAPNNASLGRCGGGLAASKFEKEVRRIGGHAVKYVTVEWVLESLKSGRRMPESTSSVKPVLFTSSSAQKTLAGMFNKP